MKIQKNFKIVGKGGIVAIGALLQKGISYFYSGSTVRNDLKVENSILHEP